jgi:hypothetical protein
MKRIYIIVLLAVGLTACTKEIDFDYHEVEPQLMIEGRVTNEGSEVLITRTRSVLDSVKSPCLTGAEVVITTDGVIEHLPYDTRTRSYHSAFRGTVGQTYHLSVNFDGHHYEATSTMPAPAPIKSTEFLWQSVVDERILFYEVYAADTEPDERNYFWYRMDRQSNHPHFKNKPQTDAYRWNVFEDRGHLPGQITCDVMCMSQRAVDEDKEENWKSILYEGDIVTFKLMTIDRSTFDFLKSLRAGQSGGANPISNIKGDPCLGYFTATSITHADTIRFSFANIREVSK